MVMIGDKNIKEFVGTVISDKVDKTRVIMVKTVKMHDLYKKRFVVRKKYYAHDEKNQSKEGDEVRIQECSPVSKTKKRKLIEIV